MSANRPFYITTAIPYANGAPHIGHAYERIATDAIQRFMRLDGRETLFVTGMDEYGLKVQQTAAKEGVTPQAFVDGIAAQFEAMGEALNARADDIVRTTQERHKRSVQAIWERMKANGDVYLSKYAGWYSVRDEAYFDASELKDGPNGGKLAPSGAPAQWVEEESYFFRLSAYGDKLLAHYEANPDFITPEHYRNEIVAFVKRGLADISISRTTFDWGVPVPGDPKHVMYVWVDALTNYITATGFPDDGPRCEILAGRRACDRQGHHPLPRDLLAGVPDVGGLSNCRARSSSTASCSTAARRCRSRSATSSVRRAWSSEYGVDQLRYFFLREVPFGQDGNYSHEAIVQRINADLANDLGNLAQRSLSMIAKNCAGAVPGLARADGPDRQRDERIAADCADSLIETRAPSHGRLRPASISSPPCSRPSRETNRYFASREPWRLAKTDPGEMRVVLFATIEVLRIAAILLQPVMPAAMGKLLDLLARAAGRARLSRGRD